MLIDKWYGLHICFFGFLRAGEMGIPDKGYDLWSPTELLRCQKWWESKHHQYAIWIISSIKDLFGKGADTYFERTPNDLSNRSNNGYPVIRGDSAGSIFHFKDERKERFVDKLWDTLHNIGIHRESYAGHSFQTGSATTAAQHGIPDKKIIGASGGCLKGEVPWVKFTGVSIPHLDLPSKQMDFEVCDEINLHRQPQTSHHRPLNQLLTTAFPPIASIDTLAVACLWLNFQ